MVAKKGHFQPLKTVLFGCHDPKYALVLLKKLSTCQKDRFPKIEYKNVEYFNLVPDYKPKFGLLDFLGLLFSFHFSRPIYSRNLLRFIFFLVTVKRWLLIMDKTCKWDLNQL